MESHVHMIVVCYIETIFWRQVKSGARQECHGFEIWLFVVMWHFFNVFRSAKSPPLSHQFLLIIIASLEIRKKSKINWPCEPAPQLGTNNCLNSKILGLRARGNVINLIVCSELDDIKRPPWSCDVMLITLYRAIFLCNTYDVLLHKDFVYQRHNVDNVLVWNLVLVWDEQRAYIDFTCYFNQKRVKLIYR